MSIKGIISKKEKHDLKKDGFSLKYNGNILTIRDHLRKPKVEIIYFGKDDMLISGKEKYAWANKKIKSVVSAYGLIHIVWGENDDEQIMI